MSAEVHHNYEDEDTSGVVIVMGNIEVNFQMECEKMLLMNTDAHLVNRVSPDLIAINAGQAMETHCADASQIRVYRIDMCCC